MLSLPFKCERVWTLLLCTPFECGIQGWVEESPGGKEREWRSSLGDRQSEFVELDPPWRHS